VEGESFEEGKTRRAAASDRGATQRRWWRIHEGNKASKQVKLAERGEPAEPSPGRLGSRPRSAEKDSIVAGGSRLLRESVDVGETMRRTTRPDASLQVGG
jgi:hypothetical protein